MIDPDRPIPTEPRDWRPQGVREGLDPHRISNPIAEPLWTGTRVLAHYRDPERSDEWGDVEVFDDEGRDAFSRAPRAFDQLRRSIRAREAVLDGVVTLEAWRPGVDIDFAGRDQVAERGDAAFVALDLLLLDDETLFDVPLLERKRLLDGLISQSILVRVSPWTMTPIAPYFRTWKRAGFGGIVVKGANSRYVPGTISMEWTDTDKEPKL
jgi:bifunctional non-homologous end joining protein LigD